MCPTLWGFPCCKNVPLFDLGTGYMGINVRKKIHQGVLFRFLNFSVYIYYILKRQECALLSVKAKSHMTREVGGALPHVPL